MAIDSLAKLTARLAYLTNADDLFDTVSIGVADIEGGIPVAIQNATKTLSRDLARRGGTGLQEVVDNTLVTAASVETVTLPATLAGIKLFALTTNPYRLLQPKDHATLINDNPSTAPGIPTAYAIAAVRTAYLRPFPDAVYTTRLVYFANLATLTASVTNPIFDNHPDIYEAAGMVEIGLLLDQDASVTKWRVVYDQKMNDLTGQDKMSGWAAAISGAAPSVQVNIA